MTQPPRARVLVVEDDPNTREALVVSLKQLGYDTLEADGVKKASAQRGFDLALLDIHLPDGNGLDALKAWREAGIDAAVVMLTSDRQADSIGRAFLSLDAWDYLPKPFGLDVLEHVVEDSLRRLTERRNIERKRAG